MGKRSRRANGEGSITKRKDGSWMGRFTVQTPSGPKRRAVYAQSYAEVRKKLTEALAERDRGSLGYAAYDAESLTVEEYLTRWLKDSVRGSVRPTTFYSYELMVRVHMNPAIGRLKLAQLSPAHVQALYREKLESGLAPKTVRYIHTTLHRALKQAVRWGLVPHNVAEAVDPPKPSTPEMRPLSPAEVRKLFDAAKGDRLQALYVLAVTTGMRQGELLGLSWEDVDLGNARLSVRRTLILVSGGGPPRLAEPKTQRSRRTICLPDRAVAAFREHRERTPPEPGLSGLKTSLVFTSTTGAPIRRDHLSRHCWKPLLRRAGLPSSVRFHDLRHTCATILLGKTVHPKFVQELLGHSSIAITLDTYSYVIPGMNGGTAGAMEEALGGDGGEELQ